MTVDQWDPSPQNGRQRIRTASLKRYALIAGTECLAIRVFRSPAGDEGFAKQRNSLDGIVDDQEAFRSHGQGIDAPPTMGRGIS